MGGMSKLKKTLFFMRKENAKIVSIISGTITMTIGLFIMAIAYGGYLGANKMIEKMRTDEFPIEASLRAYKTILCIGCINSIAGLATLFSSFVRAKDKNESSNDK